MMEAPKKMKFDKQTLKSLLTSYFLFVHKLSNSTKPITYQLQKPLLDYIRTNAQPEVLFLFNVLVSTLVFSLVLNATNE